MRCVKRLFFFLIISLFIFVCNKDNPVQEQQEEQTCSSCHGDKQKQTVAPPRDASGHTETSRITVGMHQLHLKGTGLEKPMECEECHIIPENIDDPAHLDGDNIAEVVFSGMALHRGANPVWDREAGTCKNTYCHGNFVFGNKNYEPQWTSPDSGKCTTCHGFPPVGESEMFNHATLWDSYNNDEMGRCMGCHRAVIDQNSVIVSKKLHMDGTTQWNCTAHDGCH